LKQLYKFLAFFIYTNIFIAACALALTWETFILLKLPRSLSWYLLLIFLCTLFVYDLHYYVKRKKDKQDSRLNWCRKNHSLLFAMIILSAVLIAGGVVYHYKMIFELNGHFNYNNLVWFLLIPVIALAYSHPLNPFNKKSLRQIGLLKMISLSFIWSFTTTILPVLMFRPSHKELIDEQALLALFLHHFLFIGSLCVLFNIYDYEEDKADGIKTIAVIAGPAKSLAYSKWITGLINMIAALLLLYFFNLEQPVFYIAVLLPPLLVFLLHQRFDPAMDEAVFIFRYDGMMIVQALLLIFAVLISNY
jgi:4-hydroxybenzoate polyprenyltransferase